MTAGALTSFYLLHFVSLCVYECKQAICQQRFVPRRHQLNATSKQAQQQPDEQPQHTTLRQTLTITLELHSPPNTAHPEPTGPTMQAFCLGTSLYIPDFVCCCAFLERNAIMHSFPPGAIFCQALFHPLSSCSAAVSIQLCSIKG